MHRNPRSRKEVAKTALERQTSKVLREQDFLTNRSSTTEHGVLNEYVRIEDADVVGRGSQSSSVKLYRSTKDGLLYAIKAFHQVRQGSKRQGAKDSLSLRPTHSEREEVLREADIMRRLEHPNIVRIAELIDDCYGDSHTDTDNDAMYLVMDFVEGGSWQTTLEAGAPLAEPLLQQCMRDTIRGLAYLHDAGIIHMDIKPANLLVAAADCTTKICDFGTSTLSSSIDNAKRGTTLFSAPELSTGGSGFPSSFEEGKAADVWSLGATLYFMATLGQVHTKPDEVFQALRSTPVILDPTALGRSAEMCSFLGLVLEHDPEKRANLTAAGTHPWILASTPPEDPNPHPHPHSPTANLSLFPETTGPRRGRQGQPVDHDAPHPHPHPHPIEGDDEPVASASEISAWMAATEPPNPNLHPNPATEPLARR